MWSRAQRGITGVGVCFTRQTRFVSQMTPKQPKPCWVFLKCPWVGAFVHFLGVVTHFSLGGSRDRGWADGWANGRDMLSGWGIRRWGGKVGKAWRKAKGKMGEGVTWRGVTGRRDPGRREVHTFFGGEGIGPRTRCVRVSVGYDHGYPGAGMHTAISVCSRPIDICASIWSEASGHLGLQRKNASWHSYTRHWLGTMKVYAVSMMIL